MSLTKRVGLLAGTAALSVTSGSLAGTGVDADKNLEARLAAAEAKIAQLTSTNQDDWLTEQRADEIRGIVQDVLADADTRSSLLTQGVTAGYDNGAVIGSSDGNWTMRLNLLLQSRFVYSNLDKGTGGDDENRWGWENPRIKLSLSGNVVNPDWFYRVDYNMTDRGNDGFRDGVLNAYIGHDYGNGWKVAMGAMKQPVLREELVEAENQLAVERSVLNYATTPGYQNGIKLGYEGEQWRITNMFGNGNNEFFNGSGSATNYDTEYAHAIRFEWLAKGNWGQFSDFTSPRGSEQGIMIGLAYYQEKFENGTISGFGKETYELLTVDASFEGDGWNIYAAYISADQDHEGNSSPDHDVDGWLVQGGYYLNEDWELFARYEAADWDDGSTEDLGIFTIGVTRYIAGHNAKWTTDLGIGNDSVQSGGINGAPDDVTGWRNDNTTNDEDGQYVLRTQLQIRF